MAEFASRYEIHPNMITKWKRQALAGMKQGFGRNVDNRDVGREIKTLPAKVGELIVEREFFGKSRRSMSVDGGR